MRERSVVVAPEAFRTGKCVSVGLHAFYNWRM